jgi:hypothetical protein
MRADVARGIVYLSCPKSREMPLFFASKSYNICRIILCLSLCARPVAMTDLPIRTRLKEREDIIKSYIQVHRIAKGGCQSGEPPRTNKNQNTWSLLNSRHRATEQAIRIQLALLKPNHFFDLRMRPIAEDAMYVVRPNNISRNSRTCGPRIENRWLKRDMF